MPAPSAKDGERGVSMVVGHAFTPRAEWWALCRICNLSEAAHLETLIVDCEIEDDDANPRIR